MIAECPTHAEVVAAAVEKLFTARRDFELDGEAFAEYFGSSPNECVLQRMGSCSRSKLFLLLAGLYGERPLPGERNMTLGLELMHQGTLIVDDMQDGATLRKGKPTLWQTVGMPRALDFGNALMHSGTSLIYDEFEDIMIARVTEKSAIEMLRGQDLDLTAKWRRSFDAYHATALKKTGVLYAYAGRLAALATGMTDDVLSRNMDRLLREMGVAHQICDDIMDAETLEMNTKAFSEMDHIVQNVRQSIFSVEASPSSDETLFDFVGKQRNAALSYLRNAQCVVEGLLMQCEQEVSRIVPNEKMGHWQSDIVPLIMHLSSSENGI